MRRIIPILLFAAATLGVGSCKHSAPTSSKQIITVSIEPQRWFLEQIVGDKADVNCLMARGGNPESYEPAFSHLADLERSSCYMLMGNLGFEDAIISRIKVNNPDLPVVNTSDSIILIVDDHGHDHGIDPHVWSSARNAAIIARNMARALCALDSANSQVYLANYKRLQARIDSVDSICSQILSEPGVARSFMVWHPSLSYFARDYGLTQISVGSEGKEPSVGETRDLLKRVNADSARVFLVQKDFDSSRAGVVSDGAASIRVVPINPLNYEWDNELVETARAIAGKQ